MAAPQTKATGAAAPSGDELPGAPWFKLEIYKSVPDWSLMNWYRAIACRLFITRVDGPARALMRSVSHWDTLAIDPIVGNGYYIPPHGRADQLMGYSGQAGPLIPVKELDDEVVEDLRERLEDPDFQLLAVDLTAPDQDLKRHFELWLKSRRHKGTTVRRAMTADDIANWTACQVMPYIDIQLYGQAAGISFRPIDIQKALFRDGAIDQVGREPKKILEQSTVMYAQRLLSQEHFDRLAAQFGNLPPT